MTDTDLHRLAEMVSDLKGMGCTNGDCCISPPPKGGMHTNSFCDCLRRLGSEPSLRGRVHRLLREAHRVVERASNV